MALPVYLYVPNLIGYFRIVCTLVALHYAQCSPVVTLVAYMTSFLLDAADGWAARRLGQSSKMGAVLDMVTDRFSTAGLCMVLCVIYPRWTLFFFVVVAIDFASHFAHMNYALSTGQTSHKNVDKSSGLLYLYYTNRNVLGLVCFGAEVFYVALYTIKHLPGPVLFSWRGDDVNVSLAVVLLCTPVWALKQLTNLIQMKRAMLGLDVAAQPAGTARAAVATAPATPAGRSPARNGASPAPKTPSSERSSRVRKPSRRYEDEEVTVASPTSPSRRRAASAARRA